MNRMLSSMRRHHMTKIGLSLLIVALIVGMTGCAVGATRPVRYELTIGSAEGGSVNIPGEGTFTCDAGRVVDLEAIPSTGYRFVNWTGDTDTVNNAYAAFTSVTMNDDYSITANFEETDATYYTLTTSVSPSGGGSVSPAGGTYAAGKVVTISATATSGYRFVNWTGDVSTIDDRNAASTTITIYGSYSITANFEESPPVPPDQYSLTISSSAGGYVSTPGEGTFTRDAGTVVTLVASPYSGYQFDRWTGDVGTIADDEDPTTTITMSGDYSITANFVEEGPPVPPDQYTLTIVPSPITGGTVSDLTGTSPYTEGESVSIKAVAASDYQFAGWTAPAGSFDNANAPTTTFTMPGQDVTVTAHFDQTGVTFMVSAGEGHTVGLKSNGTVVAVGDNEHGQRNVGDWKDIIQVAAGGYHTVGLKSDGTVRAVGYNNYGQCNVDDWTNVKQVAAGAYHTVGLRYDGTVLAVGYSYWWQCRVDDWRDIIQVSAGDYHTVGLKSGGTVVAVGYNYHGQCDISSWNNIIQVDAGGYHTVGLQSDRTVVARGDNDYGRCNVGDWTSMIQVAAGGYHTVGLKSDDTVRAVGYDYHGQCDVDDWENIIQVAAGGYHTVGLKSDGTVRAVGYDYHGQCNVGGWDLN